MLKKDQTLELEVIDFANEGKSIARYDDFVIFIDNAVPGDTVEAKIFKVKKNYAFGKCEKLLKASSIRIKPRCKYFGVCGGCKWQNLQYSSQIEFKRKSVIDSLERIGKIQNPEVKPAIPSEYEFFFRNKMEFSFSNKRWLLEDEKDNPQKETDFALGLHIPERFDKVLDIDECFLESEISNKILNLTRKFAKENNLDAYSAKEHNGYFRNLVIREGKKTGQIMINLVTTDDKPDVMEKYSKYILEQIPGITTIINNITQRKSLVAVGDYEKVYYGSGSINEKLGNYIFRISANSFFQTNTYNTEKLYTIVRDYASRSANKIIWDLYCGAGTISIFLSDIAEQIFGYEIVDSAIEDAGINTGLNNIKNCQFISGDLKENILKKITLEPDLMIIDPPRNGVHEDILKEILMIAPERIIYVSCNPQTQARDLIILKEKYSIVEVQPVDMFPHTMHIENIIYLNKSCIELS